MRESGIKVTKEEAADLRGIWIDTFTEMKEHFKRVPMAKDKNERYEEDDIEYDEASKALGNYAVETITGFKRSRGRESAICNSDFQNPVAHMAKEALWNLHLAGLGPNLVNFVHDEVDYVLWPEQVKSIVPIVERLWLEPGRRVFPNVKLKCETTLSLYWDKAGVEFNKLEWNGNIPILSRPKFVEEAYAKRQ